MKANNNVRIVHNELGGERSVKSTNIRVKGQFVYTTLYSIMTTEYSRT